MTIRSTPIVLFAAFLLTVPALAGAATPEPAPGTAPLTSTQADMGPTISQRLQAGGTQEVILTLSDDAGPQDHALLESMGLTLLRKTEVLPFVLARGPADAVETAATLPFVEHVAANKEMSYALDTATEATRAEDVHDAVAPEEEVTTSDSPDGITGDGVGIAVVDSGIDATHPDLEWHDKVLRNFQRTTPLLTNDVPDVAAWQDSPNTDPASGHGTHVAGIAGGTGEASDGQLEGAAPGSALYGFGMGAGLSIFAPIEAFDFILRNQGDSEVFPVPVEVVTNSYGSCGEYDPDGPYATATNALVDAGLTVIYAAGNQGVVCPTHVSIQSQHPRPGVISVANYDDGNEGTRDGSIAGSSSIGYEGNTSTWPDVAAPGTDIESTAASTDPFAGGSDYTTKSGTSMAAPHVAGIVAQLLEADPSLTPAEVESLLISTAHRWSDDIDPIDGHIKKGHGLVDAYEALHAVTDTGQNSGMQVRSLTQDGETTALDRITTPTITNETVTLAGDGLLPADSTGPTAGYSGSFQVYQGGFIDAFGVANIFTGRDDQGVVAGSTVDLAIRNVAASGGANATDGDNVTFTVADSDGVVAFQKETNLTCGEGAFGFECRASVTWNVPATQHAGDYDGTIAVEGLTAATEEIAVAGPPRDTQDASRAGGSFLPDSGSTSAEEPGTSTTPDLVQARFAGGDWVNGTVTANADGTFDWEVPLDPTDEFHARLPVEVRAVDDTVNTTLQDTIVVHRPPVPTIDEAPDLVNVNDGGDATFSASVDGGDEPVSYAWDLSFNGSTFKEEKTGQTINVTFSDPGTRTVAVQATNATGATGVATTTVEVVKTVTVVDASEEVLAGAPDEILAFELNRRGFSGPKAVDADSYWVDVGQYPNAERLEATLSWGFHEQVSTGNGALLNVNDFDLLFRVPDENNDTAAYTPNGGATAGEPETATFDDPTKEDWRVDVSPFLVAKPDTYHLEVKLYLSE